MAGVTRCLVCGSPAVVSARYNGTVTVLQDWHCPTCRASGVISSEHAEVTEVTEEGSEA